MLNIKKERRKLVKSNNPSIMSVRDRKQEFKITLQNQFVLLDDNNEDRVNRNSNHTDSSGY